MEGMCHAQVSTVWFPCFQSLWLLLTWYLMPTSTCCITQVSKQHIVLLGFPVGPLLGSVI